MPQPEITNKVAAVRKQRKVSAFALAAMAGVSRQTIYAVEAGTYVPNTAIGLRLARALGVGVEDLFSLPGEALAAKSQSRKVAILPPSQELQPGQAVELCEVNGKLIAAAPAPASWYFPPSDASVAESGAVRGTAHVHLHEPRGDFRNRVLLAGCDPAMGLVARHLQPAGIEIVVLHQNSSQSLSLLKRGLTHVAGSHLRDAGSEDSNVSAVNRLFSTKSAALISFAIWREGLVTATGNPKHIRGVEDLTRKDIAFINREAGSGSRALLDSYLKRLKINSKVVRGYLTTAPGHLAAGWEVKSGHADCCLATEACARFFGLTFVPLETVRYDLAICKKHLATPGVQALLNSINELAFRRKLISVGGYDTSVTGTRIQ